MRETMKIRNKRIRKNKENETKLAEQLAAMLR
jgi:hypothetical protein